MMKCKSLLAAVGITAASFVLAQAEVEDRVITSGVQNSASLQSNTAEPILDEGDSVEPEALAVDAPPPLQSQNSAGEMFYQMQVMQQELLELRGLVEMQTHQIKQLKQQRLDDYVDLDRRISTLTRSDAGAGTGGVQTGQPTVASPVTAPVAKPSSAVSSAGELAHYRSATKLVLVSKDYDAGIAKLKEYLSLYPQGLYSGNAKYWLGEVYLAKSNLDDAKIWFETLLADTPLHAKVPDAKYKLGTVFHQLGDDINARKLLIDASRSGGNAAKLANDYLKVNLP